jgi:serine/threonine protein phosphatase PrpC
MKKKEVARVYKFSDGKLVTIANEKIAFIKRDATEFSGFGITAAMVDDLKNKTVLFSKGVTDVELVSNQRGATTTKETLVDQLQVAIRGIMSRVVLKYEESSAQYRKFGTEELSQQPDAQLLVIASRVVRVGTEMLTALSTQGVTAAMLNNLKLIRDNLEQELINVNLKISDRDIEQENRVEAGNAIYKTLVKYTNTGQSIWATRNVAKYNDYILYNTPSGTDSETPENPA